MIKVHNLHIGSKFDLAQLDETWAIVHACKTSHKERLGYTRPPKNEPYYIEFRDENHLYLNWVDEPTGRYFLVDTFQTALDFIDEFVEEKKIFIHCDQGMSRSPSLAFTYLAKRTDFLEDDFNQAIEKFQQHYPPFKPSGIIRFIESNWNNIK
jgi:predicted protein tyrosine phosphatase